MDVNQLILFIFTNYVCFRIGMYVGAMRLLAKLEEDSRKQFEAIIDQLRQSQNEEEGEDE